MSTPPLSPVPRRWAPSGGTSASSVVETLTSIADTDPPSAPAAGSTGSGAARNNNRSSTLLTPQHNLPSIKTTSPSPQRPGESSGTNLTAPSSPLVPQQTGGSLAAFYDDVYASIDAFANQSFTLPPIPSVRGSHTGGGSTAPTSPRSTAMSPPRTPSRHRNNASPISPLSLTPPRSPTLSRQSSVASGSGGLSVGPTARTGSASLGPSTSRIGFSRPPLFRATSAESLYGLGINMQTPSVTGSSGSPGHAARTGSTGSFEMLHSESEGPVSLSSAPHTRAGTFSASSMPSLSQAQSPLAMSSGELDRISGRSPFAPKDSISSASGSGAAAAATLSPRRGAASASRASDLIKMFESRADHPPTSPARSPRADKTLKLDDDKSLPPVPASSSSGVSSIPPPVPTRDPSPAPRNPSPVRAPSPQQIRLPSPVPALPLKPKTPVSNFRNVIASWRARTASEAVEAPEPAGASGLRRDRTWNVSIRRKRRDEGTTTALAEQVSEHSDSLHTPSSPSANVTYESFFSDRRPSAPPSSINDATQIPYAGEPIRTGTLWYFNVHESDDPDEFVWVKVDARLYQEGLNIAWRTETEALAAINFDMVYCEEAASMYSPNDPHSSEDIGAEGARRQGLGALLCPFKLVFDDGVEHFACDSARERVYWVRALWNVLEGLRSDAVMTRSAPSVHSRASAHSGSAAARFSSHPVRSILAEHSVMPLQTVDDAVVVTGGGFATPLFSRNSRRLAASNSLTRERSLRRVASDINLRDPEPMAEPELLTRENAKRITLRDFAFAQKAHSKGISPPPLPEDITPTQPSVYMFTATSNIPSGIESTPTLKEQERFASAATPGPEEYPASPVPSGFTFGTPGLYPSDSVSNIFTYPRRDTTTAPRVLSPKKEPPIAAPQLPTITGSTTSGLGVNPTGQRAIVTPSTALSMHTAPTAQTSSFQTARQAFQSSEAATGSSGSSTAQAIQTLRNLPPSTAGVTTFSTAQGSVQPSAVTARDFASTAAPTAVTAPSTVVPTAFTALAPPTSVAAPSSMGPSAVTAQSTLAATAVTAQSTVTPTAVTAPSTVVPSAVTAQSTLAPTAVTAPSTMVPTAVTAPSTVVPTAVTAPSTYTPTAVTAGEFPALSLPTNTSAPLSPTPSTLTRASKTRSVLSLRTALRGGPEGHSPRSSAPSLADPSGFLRSTSPTASVSSHKSGRSDPDRPRYTLYDPPVPPSPSSSGTGAAFESASQGSATSSSGAGSYGTAPSTRRGSDSPAKMPYAPVITMSRASTMAEPSSADTSFATVPPVPSTPSSGASQQFTDARSAESMLAPSMFPSRPDGFHPDSKAPSEYPHGMPQSTLAPSQYVSAPSMPESTVAPTQYMTAPHAPSTVAPRQYMATPGAPSTYLNAAPTAYGTASAASGPSAYINARTHQPSEYHTAPQAATTIISDATLPYVTAPSYESTVPVSRDLKSPSVTRSVAQPAAPELSMSPRKGTASPHMPHFRPGVFSDVGLSTTGAMTTVSTPHSYPESSLPSELGGRSTPTLSAYSSAPPVPISKSSHYAPSSVGSGVSSVSPSTVTLPVHPNMPSAPASRFLPSEFSAPSTLAPPSASYAPPLSEYSAAPSAPTKYSRSVVSDSTYQASEINLPSVPPVSRYEPSEISLVPPSTKYTRAQSVSNYGGVPTAVGSPMPSTAPSVPPSTLYVPALSTALAPTEWSSADSTLARYISAPSHVSQTEYSSTPPSSMGKYQTASLYSSSGPRSPGTHVSVYSTATSNPAPSLASAMSGSYMDMSGRSATPVSEPDTDLSLLAGLERQSSAGSYVSDKRSTQWINVRDLGDRSYVTLQNLPPSPSVPVSANARSSGTETPKARSVAAPSVIAPPSPLQPPAPASSVVTSATRKLHRKAVPSIDLTPKDRSMPLPSSQMLAAPSGPPSGSSSSSSSSSKSWVPPRRPDSTPPSRQSSTNSSRSTRSSRSTSTSYDSNHSASTTQPRDGRDYSMLRLVNYLQGQEQVRQGQTTRMSTQLDRIEHKVDRLERIEGKLFKLDRVEKHTGKLEKMDEKLDRLKEIASRRPSPALGRGMSLSSVVSMPPPVPSKDGHSIRSIDPEDGMSDLDTERPPSPALSDGSSCSADTERPVTPTLPSGPVPFIVPDSLNQRLDDISNLLGTVLGQQKDIMQQLDDNRRDKDAQSVHGSPHMVPLPYIEEMLRQILYQVGGGVARPSSATAPRSLPQSVASVSRSLPPPPGTVTTSIPGSVPQTPAPQTPAEQVLRDFELSPDSTPRQPLSTPVPGTPASVAGSQFGSVVGSEVEGGFYPGSSSVYGSDIGMNMPIAPPNSVVNGSPSMSAILPDSLINGGIDHPNFDYEYATANLPPATPPPPHVRDRAPMPEWLRQRQLQQQQQQQQPYAEQQWNGQPQYAGQYPEHYPEDDRDVDYEQRQPIYDHPEQYAPHELERIPEEVPEDEIHEFNNVVPESVGAASPWPRAEDVDPSVQATPATMKPSPPTPKTPGEPVMTPYEDPTTRELDSNAEPAFPGHNPLQMPTPIAVDLPTPVNDKRHLPQPARSAPAPAYPPGRFQTPGPVPSPVYAPVVPIATPGAYPIPPGVNYARSHVSSRRSPMSNTFVRGGFRPRSFVTTPGLNTAGLGMGGVAGYYPGMPGGSGPMPSVREDDGESLATDGTPLQTPKSTHSRLSKAASSNHSGTPYSEPGTVTPSQAPTSITGSPSARSGSSASPATEEHLLTPVADIQINVQSPTASHASTVLQTPAETPIVATRDVPGTPASAAPYWPDNEMTRYLEQMNSHFNDRQDALTGHLRELFTKLDDLRNNVRRETVFGRVLPDGRVQLATGEIVEGIRGVPEPGPLPPSPDPSDDNAPTVPGRILPDGTILAGDKVIEGVTADSYAAHASEADLRDLVQKMKDSDQDRRIEDLQEQIVDILSQHGSVVPSEAAFMMHDQPASRAASRMSHHSTAQSHHSSPMSHHSDHYATPHALNANFEAPITVHSKIDTPHSVHDKLDTPHSVHTKLDTPGSTHSRFSPASHHTQLVTPRSSRSQLAAASRAASRAPTEAGGEEAPLMSYGNIATEKKQPKVWSTNTQHPSRRNAPEAKGKKLDAADEPTDEGKEKKDDEIKSYGNVATEKEPPKVWSTNTQHPSRQNSPETKGKTLDAADPAPSASEEPKGKGKEKEKDDEIKSYGNVATEDEPSKAKSPKVKEKEIYSTNSAHNTPKAHEFHLPSVLKDIGGILKRSGSSNSKNGDKPAGDKDGEIRSYGNIATEPEKDKTGKDTPVVAKPPLPAIPDGKKDDGRVDKSGDEKDDKKEEPITSFANVPVDDPAASPPERPSTPNKKGNNVSFSPDTPNKDGDKDDTPKKDEDQEKAEEPITSLANVPNSEDGKGDKKNDKKDGNGEPSGSAPADAGKGDDPKPKAPAVDPIASLLKPVPEDHIPIYEPVTLPDGTTIFVKTGSMPRPKPPAVQVTAPTPTATPTPAPEPAATPDATPADAPASLPPMPEDGQAGTPAADDKTPTPAASVKGGTPASTPGSKSIPLPSALKPNNTGDSVKPVSFPGAGSIFATNPDEKPIDASSAKSTPTSTPAGANKDLPAVTEAPLPTPPASIAGSATSSKSKRKAVPQDPITELNNVPSQPEASGSGSSPAGESAPPAPPKDDAADQPGKVDKGKGTETGADAPADAPTSASGAPDTTASGGGDAGGDVGGGDAPSGGGPASPAPGPAKSLKSPKTPAAELAALPPPAAGGGHSAHCEHCCPNEPRAGLVSPRPPTPRPPTPTPQTSDATPVAAAVDLPIEEPERPKTPAERPKTPVERPKTPVERPKTPVERPTTPTETPKKTPKVTTVRDLVDEPTAHDAPTDAPPAGLSKSGSKKGKEKEGDGAVADPSKEEEEAAKAAKEAAEKEASEKKEAAEKEASEKKEAAERKEAEERAAREAATALQAAQHQALVDALTGIKTVLDDMIKDQKEFKDMFVEGKNEKEERRKINSERDKKVADALETLLKDSDESKKANEEGFDGVKKAFVQANEEMNKNLGERNVDLVGQISSKLDQTKEDATLAKKEQIAFNVQHYLEDFSKGLSAEVRTLLKEVGDLRECRRALYVELSELLLMKGKQSAGDMLAIMPYPTKPPAKPEEKKKAEGGDKPKQPQAPPMWSTFMPMPAPMVGVQRPLPNPGGPPGMPMPIGPGGPVFNLGGFPPAPGAGGPPRPLPQI